MAEFNTVWPGGGHKVIQGGACKSEPGSRGVLMLAALISAPVESFSTRLIGRCRIILKASNALKELLKLWRLLANYHQTTLDWERDKYWFVIVINWLYIITFSTAKTSEVHNLMFYGMETGTKHVYHKLDPSYKSQTMWPQFQNFHNKTIASSACCDTHNPPPRVIFWENARVMNLRSLM